MPLFFFGVDARRAKESENIFLVAVAVVRGVKYVEKCREGLVHTDFLRTVFVGFPVDSERKN